MVCEMGPRDLCPNGLRVCRYCPLRGLSADEAEPHHDDLQGDLPRTLAPDLLQMLRDIDAHFTAHFGEQAWATSEIGGMTRVTIRKAEGVPRG